jgi:hypothetical protein
MPSFDCRLPHDRRAARVLARYAGILCFLAALASLAGCGGGGATFQLRTERQVVQPAQWVVAVFPLDDSGADGTIEEYTLYGHTGAQGSGAMFARGISRAVGASGPFRTIDETALRNLVLDEKLTSEEFSRLDDRRACELARKLGANLLVRGKVAGFHKSWYLFMPRATVLLELRGLDPATGETIWNATVGESSTSRSEAAVVPRISADALRAIAEGVGAPL